MIEQTKYCKLLDEKIFKTSFPIKEDICDALQGTVNYVGKRNFAAQRKIARNLKKVEYQILMDMCSRYI